MATQTMPDYAGLVQWRRSRQAGRMIGVYDGEPAGMDTEGGRWQTVCEDHGTVCSHQTFKLAQAHAAVPLEWCERCNGADPSEP